MPPRRNRGGDPDVTAPAPDDEAQNEWCIICPGATECFFGVSGEAFPTFSVGEPWCSLDCIPEVLNAENAPAQMRRFADYLRSKSKRLVITVPATCDDSTRLRLCSSVFERTGAVAVSLLSEAVACSFSCGKTEGVTVLDLGWSHATASYVAQGRTSKFVSSRTLALRNFFVSQARGRMEAAVADLEHKDEMSLLAGSEVGHAGEEHLSLSAAAAESALARAAVAEAVGSESVFNINRGAILKFYTESSSHLSAMCAKMPLEALQEDPILLVGGGGGCEGLGTKLSSILKVVVAKKLQEQREEEDDGSSDDESDGVSSSSSSSAAANKSDDDDDDDELLVNKFKRSKKAGAQKEKKQNSSSCAPLKTNNVSIATVIRVRSDAARLFVFRGAALVSSTGVFEEMGAVSVEDWCTTIENASGAGTRTVLTAATGGNINDSAASGEACQSWDLLTEHQKEQLHELVTWRLPM